MHVITLIIREMNKLRQRAPI